MPPTGAPHPQPAEAGTRADLARLAALHHEAAETARLANLLGRAPYAAALLAIASALCAAVAARTVPSWPLAAWLALGLAAVAAATLVHGRSIRAPLARAPLTAFARDYTVILTGAGIVWRLGAFLALPPGTGPWAALAFAALIPAAVAALLRRAGVALYFLCPAITLAAFAMVLRPLPCGDLAAALTLLAAATVCAAALVADRREARSLAPPAGLPYP